MNSLETTVDPRTTGGIDQAPSGYNKAIEQQKTKAPSSNADKERESIQTNLWNDRHPCNNNGNGNDDKHQHLSQSIVSYHHLPEATSLPKRELLPSHFRLDHSLLDDDEDVEQQVSDSDNVSHQGSSLIATPAARSDATTCLVSHLTTGTGLQHDVDDNNLQSRFFSSSSVADSANCQPSTWSTTLSSSATTSRPQHSWDGFIRQGTRLKMLLEDAVQQVRTEFEQQQLQLAGSSAVASSTNQKKRRHAMTDDPDDDNNSNDHDVDRLRNDDGDADAETNNHNPIQGRHHCRRRRTMFDINAASTSYKLAQEKAAQILQLQRRLSEAEVELTMLRATQVAQREEVASQQQRLDRTVEAWRLARHNASQARADADAAEATAATLAQTLQSLQTVVTETKQASMLLHQEQQQVRAAAVSAEQTLLQKEIDLTRALRQLDQLQAAEQKWHQSDAAWQREKANMQRTLQQQTQLLATMQQEKEEHVAIQAAHDQRSVVFQKQQEQAQSMLVQVSGRQAADAAVLQELQNTVLQLQTTLQQQQVHAAEQQATAQAENQRLHQACQRTEQQAQQYKLLLLSAESHQQSGGSAMEFPKFPPLPSSSSGTIHNAPSPVPTSTTPTAIGGHQRTDDGSTVLQTPAAAASNVLWSTADPGNSNSTDHVAATTPSVLVAADSESSSDPTTGRSHERLTLDLPPLSSTHTTMDTASKGAACCLCFKSSFGMMKTCQCGQESCHKRAHVHCLQQQYQRNINSTIQPCPSLAHPGTPPAPVVWSSLSSRPNGGGLPAVILCNALTSNKEGDSCAQSLMSHSSTGTLVRALYNNTNNNNTSVVTATSISDEPLASALVNRDGKQKS